MKMLVSLAALALALSAPSAQAQQSYVMWCRAGGGMQAWVTANASGGFVTLPFRAAPRAATLAAPPQPGECSWLDRPLHPGEAQRIHYHGANLSLTSTWDNGALTALDFQGAGDQVRIAQTIWNAYLAGDDIRVLVYNEGAGVLRVTGIAP